MQEAALRLLVPCNTSGDQLWRANSKYMRPTQSGLMLDAMMTHEAVQGAMSVPVADRPGPLVLHPARPGRHREGVAGRRAAAARPDAAGATHIQCTMGRRVHGAAHLVRRQVAGAVEVVTWIGPSPLTAEPLRAESRATRAAWPEGGGSLWVMRFTGPHACALARCDARHSLHVLECLLQSQKAAFTAAQAAKVPYCPIDT